MSGRLSRVLAGTVVLTTLAFLLNNHLTFWLDWPGFLNFLAHQQWLGLEPLRSPLDDGQVMLGWLQAAFDLHEDDPARIFERFEESLRKRNATQPVSEKSVGCVFKNTEAGPAGRLIEEAGCKLLRRGAVGVSGKHANYFVNLGGGTCEDFLALMAAVQERVKARSGLELTPEVKMLGVDR